MLDGCRAASLIKKASIASFNAADIGNWPGAQSPLLPYLDHH